MQNELDLFENEKQRVFISPEMIKAQEKNDAEKLMSIKELSNNLHVSDQTVRNTVKELRQELIDIFDPSKLLWRVVNGGKTLFLNEKQATAVKLRLRERNNLKDNSVVSQIGNDLEFFALLKKREDEQRILDAYRDRRIAELQAENKALEEKNTRLMHTKKTYTATELAKEIGLSSAKKLNQILKDKGIQFLRNGTWVPTAKYADKDYYEIKQDVLDNGVVIYNSRFTQKGREFVLKLFESEVLSA